MGHAANGCKKDISKIADRIVRNAKCPVPVEGVLVQGHSPEECHQNGQPKGCGVKED
jgi:hypothetical protein